MPPATPRRHCLAVAMAVTCMAAAGGASAVRSVTPDMPSSALQYAVMDTFDFLLEGVQDGSTAWLDSTPGFSLDVIPHPGVAYDVYTGRVSVLVAHGTAVFPSVSLVTSGNVTILFGIEPPGTNGTSTPTTTPAATPLWSTWVNVTEAEAPTPAPPQGAPASDSSAFTGAVVGTLASIVAVSFAMKVRTEVLHGTALWWGPGLPDDDDESLQEEEEEEEDEEDEDGGGMFGMGVGWMHPPEVGHRGFDAQDALMSGGGGGGGGGGVSGNRATWESDDLETLLLSARGGPGGPVEPLSSSATASSTSANRHNNAPPQDDLEYLLDIGKVGGRVNGGGGGGGVPSTIQTKPPSDGGGDIDDLL